MRRVLLILLILFLPKAFPNAVAAPLFTPSSKGNYLLCGNSNLPEGILSDLGISGIDSHPILSGLRKESRLMLLISKRGSAYQYDEIRAIERGITSRIVNIPSAYTIINPEKYSKAFPLRNSSGLQIRIRLHDPSYLEDARGYRYNIRTEKISQKLYCSGGGKMLARTVTRISVTNLEDSYGRALGESLMYMIEEVGLDKYNPFPAAIQTPPWI